MIDIEKIKSVVLVSVLFLTLFSIEANSFDLSDSEYVWPAAPPNDQYYQEVSNFNCIGNTSTQWALPFMNVDKVWDMGITGDESIVIAIIDSGIDWLHEDLSETIWLNQGDIWNNPNDPESGDGIDNDNNGYVDDYKGWNFITILPDNNNPMDRSGHGTEVAGVSSAKANNNLGIAGVCWNCKVMVIRAEAPSVLDNAIDYAVENGANIINISRAYKGGWRQEIITGVHNSIINAYNRGVLIVAGAGNENRWTGPEDPTYPADFTEVISVTAIDPCDTYWLGFDADGNIVGSNFGPSIELSAPGEAIKTTTYSPEQPTIHNRYSNIDYSTGALSGTSVAAPYVSGVAALLMSKDPNLQNKPEQIRQILRDTAIDLGGSGRNEFYGFGKVDAFRAIQSLKDEPNDEYSKATLIPLGTHESYIPHKYDVDWFEFQTNSAGEITITLSSIPDGNNYDFKVFDSNLNYVGGSFLNASSEEVSFFANAGTYYVYVTGYFKDYNAVDSYQLQISQRESASSINVSLNLNPNSIEPFQVLTASGQALYDTGSPVAYGTVTISLNNQTWTTSTDSQGHYSVNLNGPGKPSIYGSFSNMVKLLCAPAFEFSFMVIFRSAYSKKFLSEASVIQAAA